MNKIIQKIRDSANRIKVTFRSGNGAKQVSPGGCDATSFDVYDVALMQNPYPFYAWLREQGPVCFLPQSNCWVVSHYEEVAWALRQDHLFGSSQGMDFDPFLLNADGIDHVRARRYISPFFAPAEISKLKDFQEALVLDLLAQGQRRKRCDLVEEFAAPFTELSMAWFLGLKERDVKYLRSLSRVSRYEVKYLPTVGEYLLDLTKRREEHDQGVIKQLFVSMEAGVLSEAEVASVIRLLWIAGTTTTISLITSAASLALHDSSLLTRLRANPELIASLIEETARYESPEQSVYRFTKEEVKMGTQVIPAGVQVRICLASANRDARRFTDPDLFDIDRSPKEHLAFGFGPHACIGAILSRMESKIALQALLTGAFNVQLNLEQKAFYARSFHFRALEALNVEFD